MWRHQEDVVRLDVQVNDLHVRPLFVLFSNLNRFGHFLSSHGKPIECVPEKWFRIRHLDISRVTSGMSEKQTVPTSQYLYVKEESSHDLLVPVSSSRYSLSAEEGLERVVADEVHVNPVPALLPLTQECAGSNKIRFTTFDIWTEQQTDVPLTPFEVISNLEQQISRTLLTVHRQSKCLFQAHFLEHRGLP